MLAAYIAVDYQHLDMRKELSMKEYQKPELELLLFATEYITLGEGDGESGSNPFGEDEYS